MAPFLFLFILLFYHILIIAMNPCRFKGDCAFYIAKIPVDPHMDTPFSLENISLGCVAMGFQSSVRGERFWIIVRPQAGLAKRHPAHIDHLR
ncbi:MAG: hypothetical protein KAH06_08720 [Desulfobacterales bacterium]|nr:hypothetical protein [Desulfobacterales bacterium]